jgi:GT2 family glycosyltransferase
MVDNLTGGYLSKGRVVFTHDSRLSAVIARAREFHTSDRVSAYSPPLLFRKEIIGKIKGYYFHPRLSWLEDSEFDRRVSAAGLKIMYDGTAVVYHPPLTARKDLKSAFWYGVGHRIGYSLGINVRPRGLARSFYKYVIVASRHKGVASGLYLMIWKMVLLGGFYAQALFRLRKN